MRRAAEELVVRGLGPSDVETAADVLGAAFASDPVFVAILGSPDGDRVRGAFRSELRGVPDWAVDVATLDDVLVGVGLWQPPVHFLLKTAAAAATGLAALGPSASLRSMRHEAAVRRARPRGPAWHLSAIGVSSAARGRGVGGRLLRHRLDRLDVESAVATLEATTADSRRLYERHGFEPVDRVVGLPGTGSTIMVRPPAPRP